jgi:carbonic anhydrase
MINQTILIAIIVILLISVIYMWYTCSDANDSENIDYKMLEIAGDKHHADVLLISCIDFRFIDSIHNFMQQYKDDYDYFILAGASLGVNQQKYPAWAKTFWKHLKLAIKLHGIKKIIVIDHEDCGFYKHIYPGLYSGNEANLHEENLREMADKVKQAHPELSVEGYLMGLDGEMTKMV